MVRAMKCLGLAVVALAWAAGPAMGSVVLVDNSPPDNLGGYISGTYGPLYLANSFTLSSASTVTGVNFWGAFNPGGPTDPFTVNLFANNAGQPGTLLSTYSATLTGTANGGTISGFQDYLYQSSFPGVSLSAGTYWVSVYDTNASSGFNWLTHSQTGNVEKTNGSPTTGPWTSVAFGTLAFQIVGSSAPNVPELDPGSAASALTLLGCGAAMLGKRRKRVA